MVERKISLPKNGVDVSLFGTIVGHIDTLATSSLISKILSVLLISVFYFGLARLGLTLQMEQSQATPIWPPSGFALAMVLVFKRPALIGVVIGAFAANIVDFYVKTEFDMGIASFILDHPTEILASFTIAIGNMLEAAFGLYLVKRYSYDNALFRSIKSVVFFTLMALVICVVSATVGVFSLTAAGILPLSLWRPVWFTWWLGDATGILILTPVLYVWLVHPTKNLLNEFSFMSLLWLAGVLIFTSVTFFEWGEIQFFHAQAYLLIPVLFAIVFVTGIGTATLSVVIVSALSIWGTISGLGPFIREDQNTSLILLQGFIGVVSITLLLLDSSLRERREANDELKKANELLEERVKTRTRELEIANNYLVQSNKVSDEFASIASRDLKEPLRDLEQHMTSLQEDIGKIQHPEIVNKFSNILKKIHFLDRLIINLLHFSRIGQQNLVFKETDLQFILRTILSSLKTQLEDANVVVRIPVPLPKIKCDAAKIGEVFRNLITNAVKYNDRESKWIEIAYQEEGDVTTFSVRDNGIGIQEGELDRIFIIFRRLHEPHEYGGGAGAGMTIVKKIVERHGGRVWGKSAVGVGSTFYFTLNRNVSTIEK